MSEKKARDKRNNIDVTEVMKAAYEEAKKTGLGFIAIDDKLNVGFVPLEAIRGMLDLLKEESPGSPIIKPDGIDFKNERK